MSETYKYGRKPVLLMDKEEKEDWKKGKCLECKADLVIWNDKCFAFAHRQEMKYLPINSPYCLKKND